jgi:MoxR-like ATPase
LLGAGYVCDDDVAVPVYLALALERPLLIEGEPGVGKTELARALAAGLGLRLIRLQCYEGLDENRALYEWNYQRQLLRIQLERDLTREEDLFGPEYLLERPLLAAIRAPEPVVLLIDEVDRTDEQFEAFLFEVLSDFQVSIPELGTVRAQSVPVVVLTSNRARELSDALRRRCVYLYIDYPSMEREVRIIEARLPGAGSRLTGQVASAVAYLRHHADINKRPSIAETLDWVAALLRLGKDQLDADAVDRTLNVVLKDREDLRRFRSEPAGIVAASRSAQTRP